MFMTLFYNVKLKGYLIECNYQLQKQIKEVFILLTSLNKILKYQCVDEQDAAIQ